MILFEHWPEGQDACKVRRARWGGVSARLDGGKVYRGADVWPLLTQKEKQSYNSLKNLKAGNAIEGVGMRVEFRDYDPDIIILTKKERIDALKKQLNSPYFTCHIRKERGND